MRTVNQFAILFAVCAAGVLLSNLLPFPVPSSVAAMILMFLLLLWRALRPEVLRDVSEFMLGNMSMFFIPAGAAILEHAEALRDDALVLLFICVASMALTFSATLLSVRVTVKILRARREA